METILTVGFNEKFDPDIGFNLIQHDHTKPLGVRGKEKHLLFSKIANSVSYVVVNLGKENFSADEAILTHLAYTNSTPIFGVGIPNADSILNGLIIGQFGKFDDVVDHLVANYRIF